MGGLVDVQQAEDGGGDVSEGASVADSDFVALVSDEDEGDGVGGVGGVGAAGGGVNEHFCVAVVGGDEHAAALGAEGLVDSTEAGVYGFYGADGGRDLAGVADHVCVGEVDDDDVEGGV